MGFQFYLIIIWGGIVPSHDKVYTELGKEFYFSHIGYACTIIAFYLLPFLFFKEVNFLQAASIKHNLVFTGEGSKLNDLKKIIDTKFPNCIFDTNQYNSMLSKPPNRELLACYGALKILTEGFASEAIAMPNNNLKNKHIKYVIR